MVKIFDGIDAAVFSPSPSHVKKRTILMVSRVTPERDIEMFIQIAFLLRKTFPHLGFVHIGYYARDVDARYFASLRTMVKAHGLSLCFRFIPYQTSAKKMAAYYRSAWASVVPARQFALPNVAIEALLCGTPVVAFRTGGNAEIVSHGETGYLVDTQDPRAYVRWLRQILSHPSLRARLSRQGRRDAMKFSNEAQLIRILELYRRMDPGWTA
jgi:glycosyltransferase involved in cell wall biosynthesis